MMNYILIIPDIHGRIFWKEPCKEFKGKHIVFLGDYLDPYKHQNISEKTALENFKEILEFKKNNKDLVTLLLGNHDLHYKDMFKDVYRVRFCYSIAEEAKQLFENNKENFQIAYEITADNTKILFTHAGVTENWLKVIHNEIPCRPWRSRTLGDYSPDLVLPVEPNAESLNNLLTTEEGLIDLWMVSEERGGIYNFGSPIWAHISEHLECPALKGIYQIFGHTISFPEEMKPWITDEYAMLDAQQCFVLAYDDKTFRLLKYSEYKDEVG